MYHSRDDVEEDRIIEFEYQ